MAVSVDAFTQKVTERCSATPLQRVRGAAADEAGVRVYLKRDDLIHPQISGNKWRKLKYNLLEARRRGYDALLTFGGAYSNHLHATAAAGQAFGFRTIGVVRGEETFPLNPTLAFARSGGMHLHYVSRDLYRLKTDEAVFESLRKQYGPFYLLPEGGSNALAVKGVAELVDEIDISWDFLCCPCGTGATLAGLVAGAGGKGQIIGFAALKGGSFLHGDATNLLRSYYATTGKDDPHHANWQIQTDYHFGGYAKTTPALLAFIRQFEGDNGIRIEQVYTGKMLFGLEDLLRKGFFSPGSVVVAVHTGGLQGRSAEI